MERRDAGSQLQEVIRGTALGLGLKMASIVVAFVLNVVIARLLGPELTGMYFIGLTVATIGGLLGCIGLENSVVKFIGIQGAAGNWAGVRSVYLKGVVVVAAVSVGMGAVIAGTSQWAAQEIFGKPAIAPVLLGMAVAVPFLSMYTVHAAYLRGIRRVGASVSVLSVWPNVIALMCLLVLVPLFGLGGAVASYVMGCVGSLAIGWLWWRRAIKGLHIGEGSVSLRELMQSSVPLAWSTALRLGCVWAPTLMLGVWTAPTEVGIYEVAHRTALLVTVVLAAVNAVSAPRFAALYHNGDCEGLEGLARRSAGLAALAALPICGILIFCSGGVLSLFGAGFEEGDGALRVLAMGQTLNVLTGSTGVLLMMCSKERTLRRVMFGGLCTNVLICALFVPNHGAIGAAWGSAMTTVGINAVGAILVWRHIGILCIPSAPWSPAGMSMVGRRSLRSAK